MFKNIRLLIASAIFVLAFSAAAYAAPDILSVTINYTTNQITVTGTELVYGKATPKVIFDGANLTVMGTPAPTKTALTAQLPGHIEPRLI